MASAPIVSPSLALNTYIDYSLLLPTASETQVRKLCEEAWNFAFRAICVPPVYVKYTRNILEYCPVPLQVITVIGYPMGYSTTEAKLYEAGIALDDGAQELDVVMNLAQFKSMAYLSVQQELRKLAELAHNRDALLKVTLDVAHLDRFELHTACELCTEAKVDVVKISTDSVQHTSSRIATETIAFIQDLVPDTVGISATIDSYNYTQAREIVATGGARLDVPMGAAFLSEL